MSRMEKFVVQFDIRHVGMPLGFTAVTLMWRALAQTFGYRGVPNEIWFALWGLTVALASTVFGLLIARGFLYPHLVRREFANSFLTNFFASPCIVSTGLIVSVPPGLRNETVVAVFFYILLAYHGSLALFWYGDWLFSSGHTLRRISALYFMAVINFFTLASVAASIDRIELARYLIMLGSLFWLLVFIDAFSFLSNSIERGVETPSPTLFLFLAPPAAASLASLAIARAAGEPVLSDKLRFFAGVTCFIFLLLLRLFGVFRKLVFTVAWWAYVFPLGNAATLAIELTDVYDDLVASTIVAFTAVGVCTFAVLAISVLTARALFKGEIPKSELSLRVHCQYVRGKSAHVAATEDEEARSLSVLGDNPSVPVQEQPASPFGREGVDDRVRFFFQEMDGLADEVDGVKSFRSRRLPR